MTLTLKYGGPHRKKLCDECPPGYPPHIPGCCALAEFVRNSRKKPTQYDRVNTRRVSKDAQSEESYKFVRRDRYGTIP